MWGAFFAKIKINLINREINGKYYRIFRRDEKEMENNNYGCNKLHIT